MLPGSAPIALIIAGICAVLFMVPWLANRAFRKDSFLAAHVLYRLCVVLSGTKGARRRARVSSLTAKLAKFPSESTAAQLRQLKEGADPSTSATILNNLAYYYAMNENFSQSDQLSKESIAIRPNCAAFLHTQSVLLVSKGKTKAALRLLHHSAMANLTNYKSLHRSINTMRTKGWDSQGKPGYAKNFSR